MAASARHLREQCKPMQL